MPQRKSDFGKFIDENLINKIGILITVIGVGIGAKYAIENELISPLTRIILGYLVGLGQLGFGIKLKAKYEDFLAVLVSGVVQGFGGCPMAKDELTGNMPTEKMLSYFTTVKADTGVKPMSFEASFNKASDILTNIIK